MRSASRSVAHESPIEIGDAIVIGGRKYRVRAISEAYVHLAEAGPRWRHTPIKLLIGEDHGPLAWDRGAGVWRLALEGDRHG